MGLQYLCWIFTLYIAQKDSDNFIAVLKNMLDSMSKSGIHQNQNYIVI